MPRADYECAPCAKAQGVARVVHENLPVESKACPITGKRRGFVRLYDGVMVSTKGHRIAKVLDPLMAPQLQALQTKNNTVTAAKASMQATQERAETIARETPGLSDQQREAVHEIGKRGPGNWMPAGAAMGMADAHARFDSRNYIWPHVRRRVVPIKP